MKVRGSVFIAAKGEIETEDAIQIPGLLDCKYIYIYIYMYMYIYIYIYIYIHA
jgi:hypothetical protein